MSRRYGRNQKRKHKKEIASLLQKCHEAEVDNFILERALQHADRTVSEMISIIESVCEYSVAIPPKKFTGNGFRDSWRMGCLPKENYACTSSDNVMTSIASYSTVDLYALRVYLRDHREKFQTAVHMTYSYGSESVYMISIEALQSSTPDVVAKYLVPEVTACLLENIQNYSGRYNHSGTSGY